MAIIISKTKEAPAVYGANETPALPGLNSVVAANMIGFGKGSLESVLAHVGEKNPSTKVYFGFDDTTGAGAIVTNGKLVSSKILDIIVTKEEPASEGKDAVAPKLTVKYVDAANNEVSEVDLPLVSEASVKEQIAALKKEIMTGEATEAVNTAYDTLLEISKFIEANDQLTDAGDIVTAINGNTDAIGVAGTPAELYKEGDEIPEDKEVGDVKVEAVPGTGLTGRVEALEAKEHATSDVSAAEGKYISGIQVAENGAVTITETALPEITIASDSVDYVSVDSDNKHKIGVKTTSLGDAVGLTKGEDGTWSAADGTTSDAPGLATAADVAAEIVADEEVIAAALNEHEMRIKTLEAADAVHTTVANKTTGHITVATNENKVVTITEDDDAEVTYTAATDSADASLTVNDATLLLNGSAITAIKNYVDAVLAAKVSDLEAKLAAETTRATNAENALVEVVNALNSALTWTEA